MAAFCDSGLSAPGTGADVLACADVALAGEYEQPGVGEFADDAPDPGCGQVMCGAGQRARHPQDLPVWSGDDLEVIPCFLCLPE